MSAKNDGGPAFPTHHNTPTGCWSEGGMTLRDWFAGQAPEIPEWFERKEETRKPGPVPHPHKPGYMTDGFVVDQPAETQEQHFFRWRWHYADGMLAQRAKGQP